MEEGSKMKPLDLWSRPYNMGNNGNLFHHSYLKYERIHSNGNKRLQELLVDIVTDHDRYYNIARPRQV